MPTKLTIVYYSTYGTNHQIAQIAAEAARATGADVRLRRVAETAPDDVVNGQDAWKAAAEKQSDIAVVTPDDMDWADAYIFSAPTRFGGMPSQLRAFIDTLGGLWAKGKLANKAVSAMTSAQNPHGGQEATLLGLYTTLMHWGTVIVAPGYTDEALYATGGNPYGYSHTQGSDFDDKAKASISHQVRRTLEIAAKLKSDVQISKAA